MNNFPTAGGAPPMQQQPSQQQQQQQQGQANNINRTGLDLSQAALVEAVAAAAAALPAVPPAAAPAQQQQGNNNNNNNNNTRGLELRQEELTRARQIKQAAIADERIDHSQLMDFDYVQWALTTVGLSLEVVLEKIYLMQCFREEYNLKDNLEECAELVLKYMLALLPGFVVSMDYIPADQNYAFVFDLAPFDPQRIQTHEDYRTYLGGYYYMWQAAFQNFVTIRKGFTYLVECDNTGFSVSEIIDNFDVVSKYMNELFLNYPLNDAKYYFFNSPAAVNVCYGIVKRGIPPERRKAWQFGVKLPGMDGGRRISSLYSTPSPAHNTGRVIQQICVAANQRYRNRSRFSLDDCRILLQD